MKKILLILLILSGLALAQTYPTIADKDSSASPANTDSTLTAREVMQLKDAIINGTKSIKPLSIYLNSKNHTDIMNPADVRDSINVVLTESSVITAADTSGMLTYYVNNGDLSTVVPANETDAAHDNFSELAGTVADNQIAAGAVDGGSGGEIQDGTITADDLANNAVTDAKVADDISLTNLSQVSDYLEVVQDVVGGMFSGNTETNITANYQDGDGTIDLVVSLSGDSSWVSATIGKLTVTDSIKGLSVLDIDTATVNNQMTIPSGTNPTTDAAGEIAVDSDDDGIEFYSDASMFISAVVPFAFLLPQPDSLQELSDAFMLIDVSAIWAPHGITLTSLKLTTSASSSITVNFEEWTDPSDGSPATLDAVSTSTSYEQEETTLTDAAVAAGNQIYVDLPTGTGLAWILCSGTYRVNPGD